MRLARQRKLPLGLSRRCGLVLTLVCALLMACQNTTPPPQSEEPPESPPMAIWAVDTAFHYMTTLDPATVTKQVRFSLPGGILFAEDDYDSLAWDGEALWLSHINSDTLFKVDLQGNVLEEFTLPDITIKGLTFANGSLYAVGYAGAVDTLFKINPTDGSVTHLSLPHLVPKGIAYDGSNTLWIAYSNWDGDLFYSYDLTTGETVWRFPAPDYCIVSLDYHDDRLVMYGCSGLTYINPSNGEVTDGPIRIGVGNYAGLAMVPQSVTDAIPPLPSERPVAYAGSDQLAVVGQTVTVDGISSHDPESSPLTYHWGFSEKPADSLTELGDSLARSTTFTIDKGGTYTVRLRVNDGELDSVVNQMKVITETVDSCFNNTICGTNSLCLKSTGNCGSGVGMCTTRPTACPAVIDEVCGCDGVTYNNACEAAAYGVNVDHSGAC